jgi:hypothetical protein
VQLDLTKHNRNMLGLIDEFADKSSALLTVDQRQVFKDLQNEHGVHLLSGAPGSGKTFLTQYLTYNWRVVGKKVLLLATTGAAAVRLSSVAKIVHSAFRIPKDGRPLATMLPTDAMFEAILKADVIVIDEMSMLTSHVFNLLMYRLGLVVGCPYSALQSKLLLLVGDHAQLPAVCHCSQSSQPTLVDLQPTSEEKDKICGKCHISATPCGGLVLSGTI